MRVLIVSDTHGALDARIEALARASDLVVHAGDVGAPGVLDALAAPGPRLVAVRGNNDVAEKWPRAGQARLRELPEQAAVELPGGVLVVVHGDRFPASRRHARLRAAFPAARAVVYGHSHRLCFDRDALPWVLNPGAAGRSRTFGGPSCLQLTATTQAWSVEALRFAG